MTADPAQVPRARVLKALRKAGVEVRPVVAGNFLQNDVVRLLNHRVAGKVPGAERIHEHGFFLGNHPYDLTAAFDLLATTLDGLPKA
jgi:CDP-6-deoxy-D-xylo-4-hexulose-3-dehydrase